MKFSKKELNKLLTWYSSFAQNEDIDDDDVELKDKIELTLESKGGYEEESEEDYSYGEDEEGYEDEENY